MLALFFWLKSFCTKIIIFEEPFNGLISVFNRNYIKPQTMLKGLNDHKKKKRIEILYNTIRVWDRLYIPSIHLSFIYLCNIKRQYVH